MYHPIVERNRNKKLFNRYRMGTLLFAAGAAAGAAVALHFAELNRMPLADSIGKQTETIRTVVGRERSRNNEMELLRERNRSLMSQNRRLLAERARMLDMSEAQADAPPQR